MMKKRSARNQSSLSKSSPVRLFKQMPAQNNVNEFVEHIKALTIPKHFLEFGPLQLIRQKFSGR